LLVQHGEYLAILESVARSCPDLLHQTRHLEAETRVINGFYRSGKLAQLTGGAIGDQDGLDGPNLLDGFGNLSPTRADEEGQERKIDQPMHHFIPCTFH
jgi:hypothetical protein